MYLRLGYVIMQGIVNGIPSYIANTLCLCFCSSYTVVLHDLLSLICAKVSRKFFKTVLYVT